MQTLRQDCVTWRYSQRDVTTSLHDSHRNDEENTETSDFPNGLCESDVSLVSEGGMTQLKKESSKYIPPHLRKHMSEDYYARGKKVAEKSSDSPLRSQAVKLSSRNMAPPPGFPMLQMLDDE